MNGAIAPGVPTGLNRDPVTGGGQPFMGRPLLNTELQPALGQPLEALSTPDPATHTFGVPNTHWDKMAGFGVLPYDLSESRGPRYNSIEAAYNNAQDSAMEMRRTGRRGPDILPGEMSFDDYKKNFSFNDGFITNNTGADKFYEKDLTSPFNRFETSSIQETFRNPDSPYFGKNDMGIAKDRYVALPGSSQQNMQKALPGLATGGIANHFRKK